MKLEKVDLDLPVSNNKNKSLFGTENSVFFC